MDIPTQRCKKCQEEKSKDQFSIEKNGRGESFRRKICRSCRNEQITLVGRKDAERLKVWKNNSLKRAREDRNNPEKRAKFILSDSKKVDKEKGRENNLDLAFVEDKIKNGCRYCGSSVKMTLDRMDNSAGHTKENVVESCMRCNYLRRDMPYTAWLEIVPGVKAAFEKGLFGDWVGGIGRNHFIESEKCNGALAGLENRMPHGDGFDS